MVTRRGYSLLEVIVAMAIFGMFLFMVTALTMSMKRSEKAWPVNLMKNPQVTSVLARLRRDVLDATPPYYPGSIGPFPEQTSTALLLSVLEPDGTSRAVVWDFTIPGEVHRRAYLANQEVADWVARGTPQFSIAGFDELGGEPEGLRIQATDEHKLLVIDQILQPRARRPAETGDDTPAEGEP